MRLVCDIVITSSIKTKKSGMKKQSRRAAPKKLRAVQTSQHWHVAHHRHTGHITHRRTTSYPALAMILLCVGVFLAGWTRFVTADSFIYPPPASGGYTVRASVPGPAPTIAATIDSPLDGTTVTAQPITVSGSCPLNTYETLYRNGAFSGVALCNASGQYELQTGLFPGVNQLRVRVFSSTDVPGPMSSTVSVTYKPSVPPKPPATGGESTAGSNSSTTNTSGPEVQGQPLIFKTTFVYEGHYVGTTSTWELDIEGGNAPYAISVDWGDGQHSLVSRPRAGNFTLEHVYHKPGGYHGSYVTKFLASDADGSETLLQLMAIVNNPPDSAKGSSHSLVPGAGSLGNGSGATHTFDTYILTLLKYIWPGYLVVVLMLVSFWLGERREFQHLKPRLKKVRHA